MGSSAEPGRALALVMKAVEPQSGGADIGFVLTFREPICVERLYRAYCRLVEQNVAARMRFSYDPTRRRYRWMPLPEPCWRTLLTEERLALVEAHDLDALASAWRPLDARFPLLVHRIDERRCYVSVQHAWADGLGAVTWIRALLRLYGGAEAAGPLPARRPASTESNRVGRELRSLLWFLWFALLRFPRSHARSRSVVDLSHGARPGARNAQGYALLRYRISRPELLTTYRRAWQSRLSLTQYFCGVMSEVVLEQAPAGMRVRLSIPVAIDRPPPPGSGETAWPGLDVSSLAFEIEAGRDWQEQVRREFRWLDRGIPAAYDRCLGLLVGLLGDRRALRFFRQHLTLPHADPRRGYLRQFTCIVSSLGVVDAPEVREHLDSLSVHGKSEQLSMGLIVTGDGLTLDVIPPNHVFDAASIARLMDRVMQRLVE